MTEVISLGVPPKGFQNIHHDSHSQYDSFALLISNLFSRSSAESDTDHPVVIILNDDKHNRRSSDSLEGLDFHDKVLLLKYFFNQLNIIVIHSSSVADPAVVNQLNEAIININTLISNRISRIQTWTGTGSSTINDFYFHDNSENRFAINEIICTMSYTLNNHANKSQISTDHIIHLKDLIVREIDFRSLLSNSSPQHLSKLCHLVGHWSFPAHELTNDDLVYCVYLMIKYALNQAVKHIDTLKNTARAVSNFHVPSNNELLALVFMVRDSYRSGNPFHNFRHAVDVMQACFHFLIRLNCLPPFKQLETNPNADELAYVNIDESTLDKTEELATLFGHHKQSSSSASIASSTPLNPLQTIGILVAALGHDIGHPGLTNAFMIKYEAPTSLIFNERSVLESFHSSVFINKILVINWPSLLKLSCGNKEDSPFSIKDLIISSILATDMAEHFEYIHKLKNLKDEALGDDNMVKLISSLLIKCADISNVTRPLRVSSQWAMVLAREFEEVASLERRITTQSESEDVSYSKVPVDLGEVLNSNPQLHKGQIFFISTFAENLFNNISELLPELKFTCGIIRENKEFWLNR